MNGIANEKTSLRTFVENALLESFSKIFIVNVNTGEYQIYRNDGALHIEELEGINDIYAYMEKLITANVVYPEYATACRRFSNPEYVRKSVFSGERRIVQSYRRRTKSGDKWVTFAIIPPRDCDPENPLVLYTWREADSDAITLLDTLPTISSLYDKLIRINLSNNTYEPVIVDADEQEQLTGGVINMYEWWAGYSKDGNIATDDMSSFGTLTRTGSLQKRFAEDPTPVNFRYRRKVNDEFRWVQLQIAPSVGYSEDNQIMLLSLKDIHEEYAEQIRSRQKLIDNMNTDALTNLFNRLKYNEDLENLMKSDGPLFTCLYIDVNGLHELNNLLGHQKGDDMLCCVADTLRDFFPDERVYRIGGDEFVVTSINMSKHAVEHVVEKVRRKLLEDNYEISVGIETGTCGESVEKIVAAAELAMRNDKASFYMRKGDRRKGRQMNKELEQMLVEKQYNERFLNAIADQFAGVFFVDMISDTIRHVYMPDLLADLMEEAESSFIKAIRLYAERFVRAEDHPIFDEILDPEKLSKKLSKSKSFHFTYQRTDGTSMDARILDIGMQQDSRPVTLWIVQESR